MRTSFSRNTARAVSAVTALVVLGGLSAAPAWADPAGPDLKLTVAPEPGSYVLGQSVPIKVTITNNSDAVATGVKTDVIQVTGPNLYVSDWQDLDPNGPGGTIAPHATREIQVTGQISRAKEGDLAVKFVVRAVGEADPVDNDQEVAIQMPPPRSRNTVRGILFTDTDDDGAYDDGEGLPGIKMRIFSGAGPTPIRAEQVTDANGRFVQQNLPPYMFSISAIDTLPDGWVIKTYIPAAANGNDTPEIQVRAVRPLSERLKPTIYFNDGPYLPGATAHLSVTLSNKGTQALENIVAQCGGGQQLEGAGDPAHWGDLAYSRGGVTINANETKTFAVTGIVSADAAPGSTVTARCAFGVKDGEYSAGSPVAEGVSTVIS